jgi:hypothetical protein
MTSRVSPATAGAVADSKSAATCGGLFFARYFAGASVSVCSVGPGRNGVGLPAAQSA